MQQNLSVLARGHTLLPSVVLLGGANYFVRGLQDCWRDNILAMWRERGVAIPETSPPEDLVSAPAHAHYFGAIGAALHGRAAIQEDAAAGAFLGTERLRHYVNVDRFAARRASGEDALVRDEAELRRFRERYEPAPWHSPRFPSGTLVEGFIGLDGGSTSTKAVLIGADREVLAKAYQLSKGNPIEDTKDVLGELRRQVEDQGCRLGVLGVGVTGYAKDILKDVIGADVALVETVAHTQSGLHYFPDADVICDVGGQDIKVIFLKDGAVRDFKLNTQCSAGNGYYLQATATAFGHDVEEYADLAFTAETMPVFGYGCAVFMQSDVVDFQRQGWRANEILAGLAAALPKNIWLYVCRIPGLAKLGKTFILQGGTQRNLAAVKAQVDFIEERFAGTGVHPRVIVHPHCGVSGAIGCAFEVHRKYLERGLETSFIGLDSVQAVHYHTIRDESTRCRFCRNRCLRTFIDVSTNGRSSTRRLVIASCERGAVETVSDMRVIANRQKTVADANPDLSAVAARQAFAPVHVASAADKPPRPPWWASPARRRALARRADAMDRRKRVRIGMPRALNMYGLGPLYMGFFQSLGVPADRLVWSDPTTHDLYKEGATRGSVDPCFASKVAIPHVHNLLFHKHTGEEPLTHLFFPMTDSLPTWLEGAPDSRGCPTAVGTPESTYAAFTAERDLFAERGITYLKPFLNLNHPEVCAGQLAEALYEDLGVTEPESACALEQGFRALDAFRARLRRRARAAIDELEREARLGIVLLARPYMNDPGLNHGICAEFQQLGYPVFTPTSLPVEADFLERLFGDEVRSGLVDHPLSINDVWKHGYATNAAQKLWAAKVAARHPNLVALEISNFKCGHDAPIYTTIEEIVGASGTPYFYFKDLDENKPEGSIKLRIETIAYFLRRYHEGLRAGELGRKADVEFTAVYETEFPSDEDPRPEPERDAAARV